MPKAQFVPAGSHPGMHYWFLSQKLARSNTDRQLSNDGLVNGCQQKTKGRGDVQGSAKYNARASSTAYNDRLSALHGSACGAASGGSCMQATGQAVYFCGHVI